MTEPVPFEELVERLRQTRKQGIDISQMLNHMIALGVMTTREANRLERAL